MHAKPERVRARRFQRRLKAALSIGVALCAGAFLACQKAVVSPEAGTGTGTDTDANANQTDASNSSAEAASTTIGDASDGAALAIVDAGKSDALATTTRGKNPRDAAVDRREHRKGMPVPDNLLE